MLFDINYCYCYLTLIIDIFISIFRRCASADSIKFSFFSSCFAFVLWKLGDEYFGMNPSRRVANFSYVMLSICFNTFAMGTLMVMELFVFPRPPKLYVKTFAEKFGRSSMNAFMISNVMTFVANRIWDTERIQDAIYGFSILVLYMVFVCFLVTSDSIFHSVVSYLTLRVHAKKET